MRTLPHVSILACVCIFFLCFGSVHAANNYQFEGESFLAGITDWFSGWFGGDDVEEAGDEVESINQQNGSGDSEGTGGSEEGGFWNWVSSWFGGDNDTEDQPDREVDVDPVEQSGSTVEIMPEPEPLSPEVILTLCPEGTDVLGNSSGCAEYCDTPDCSVLQTIENYYCIECIEPTCPPRTGPRDVCENFCEGECVRQAELEVDLDCFVCVQPEPEPVEEEECPIGSMDLARCVLEECDCIVSSIRSSGDACYTCAPEPEPVLPPEPEPEPVVYTCPESLLPLEECSDMCEGTCIGIETLDDGSRCYGCILSAPEPEEIEFVECRDLTFEESECEKCDRGCSSAYIRKDGVECFECTRVHEAVCADGLSPTKDICESQCSRNGGVCVEEDGCFECLLVTCPEGTYRDVCPSECTDGCERVGEQHGVECLVCSRDCASRCAQYGFGPEETDHSDAILRELNARECVSGASITIETATVGDCDCIGGYTLEIDATPPTCANTPCGNVACGQSVSCPGGPHETVTVHCNWGGWEKIGKHQFRPLLGG